LGLRVAEVTNFLPCFAKTTRLELPGFDDGSVEWTSHSWLSIKSASKVLVKPQAAQISCYFLSQYLINIAMATTLSVLHKKVQARRTAGTLPRI
jgi:hypothetical protein